MGVWLCFVNWQEKRYRQLEQLFQDVDEKRKVSVSKL